MEVGSTGGGEKRVQKGLWFCSRGCQAKRSPLGRM